MAGLTTDASASKARRDESPFYLNPILRTSSAYLGSFRSGP